MIFGTRTKRVALSFDDGPTDDTSSILDCLEEHRAVATFFVVGSRIKGREATLQRAVALGCEIGNHTHTHPRLSDLPESEIERQLTATSDAISRAIGKAPKLMRPPYGADADRSGAIAAMIGMTTALWTLSTHDYDGKSADRIVELVLADIRPGAVVLLHDGSPIGESRRSTVEAVRKLVPALLSRGYATETVSAILARSWSTRRRVIPGSRRRRGRVYG